MDWFTGLFLCAAVIALLTGKAYFRRTVAREEEPSLYWTTVASYVLLALLMPVLGWIKAHR